MYKIIGADGQQYGPVNVQTIRQWLAENRLKPESFVQAEGSTDWKPLSLFPELAPEPKSVPPTITPLAAHPPVSGSNPRASNKIPAAICGIMLGGLGIHKFILGYTGAGLIMLLVSVISCGTLYPVMHLIGLIEGIIYLTKTDDEFARVYVDNRKEWF